MVTDTSPTNPTIPRLYMAIELSKSRWHLDFTVGYPFT
jgi:hypothetical protein